MPRKPLPSTLRYVLTNVQDNPNISATELASLTGFSSSSMSRSLRSLVEQGEIYTPDATAGRGHPKRYTAKTQSEVAKLRAKLAEAHALLAQRPAAPDKIAELVETIGKRDLGIAQLKQMIEIRDKQIAELEAFKATAIEKYPDLAVSPVVLRAREILAAKYPEGSAERANILSGGYDAGPSMLALIDVLGEVE